jgi:hypothetical protein
MTVPVAVRDPDGIPAVREPRADGSMTEQREGPPIDARTQGIASAEDALPGDEIEFHTSTIAPALLRQSGLGPAVDGTGRQGWGCG